MASTVKIEYVCVDGKILPSSEVVVGVMDRNQFNIQSKRSN